MLKQRNKHKYDSSFKYNPLDPRNWNLLCIITVISSILLLIDWIYGIMIVSSDIRYSLLTKIFPGNDFFLIIFPLISIIGILCLTPILNKEFDDTPFFGAILVRLILYFGSCQFTLIGQAAQYILTLSCSILIVTVLVFIILIEIDGPIEREHALYLGIIFLAINFFINLLIHGWRINETWTITYILISIPFIILIQKKDFLIGAIPILILAILNDHVGSFGISGLNVGALLMKFTAGIIVLKLL